MDKRFHIKKILEARDKRANLQKEIISETKTALLVLHMNIPGLPKRSPALTNVFFSIKKNYAA